jgi:hypothetical protein
MSTSDTEVGWSVPWGKTTLDETAGEGQISEENEVSGFAMEGRFRFVDIGVQGGPQPRITLPAIRRVLQQLLRPLARPDCCYCNPYYHSLNQRAQVLTE